MALGRRRLDADPVEVALHRADAGLPGPRLGVGVARGRARHLAPVVEDVVDVLDVPGLLGDAEHQVVVLRPVVAVAEAADLLDQAAPDHREVRGVHVVAQPLGREVGLVVRRVRLAVHRHVVLVAVAVVEVRDAVDLLRHHAQRAGLEDVVVVEQGHEVAARPAQRVAGRRDDAAVLLALVHPDPRVGRGELGQAGPHPVAGGAVVDEDPLPVGPLLREHRGDGVLERVPRRVVDRGEDGEPRGPRGRLSGGGGRVVGHGVRSIIVGRRGRP